MGVELKIKPSTRTATVPDLNSIELWYDLSPPFIITTLLIISSPHQLLIPSADCFGVRRSSLPRHYSAPDRLLGIIIIATTNLEKICHTRQALPLVCTTLYHHLPRELLSLCTSSSYWSNHQLLLSLGERFCTIQSSSHHPSPSTSISISCTSSSSLCRPLGPRISVFGFKISSSDAIITPAKRVYGRRHCKISNNSPPCTLMLIYTLNTQSSRTTKMRNPPSEFRWFVDRLQVCFRLFSTFSLQHHPLINTILLHTDNLILDNLLITSSSSTRAKKTLRTIHHHVLGRWCRGRHMGLWRRSSHFCQ